MTKTNYKKNGKPVYAHPKHNFLVEWRPIETPLNRVRLGRGGSWHIASSLFNSFYPYEQPTDGHESLEAAAKFIEDCVARGIVWAN